MSHSSHAANLPMDFLTQILPATHQNSKKTDADPVTIAAMSNNHLALSQLAKKASIVYAL